MQNPFEIIQEELKEIKNLLIEKKNMPNREQHEEKDVMTVAECAKMLNLSKQTVYQHVSNKSIPFSKMKGTKRLYFSKKRITKWLEEAGSKTTTELEMEAIENLKKKK